MGDIRENNAEVNPKRQGLVQIFTGDGKGKTTAALGTALRALGHGLRVFVAVFMKGDYPYGEWEALARFPNVTVKRFGFLEFTDPYNVKPEEREQAQKALNAAREAMLSGKYDLIILDEVNIACAWKIIGTAEVVHLIKDRPNNVELILTGRRADQELIDLADLVTECNKIKHPYDKGTLAREGIEF